jgi:UDP-N-acetylmuramoylalanine--D-glutamate ligase
MTEPLPSTPTATSPAPFLAERAVLVLGLGASGLAMARWCVRAGARVTVADTREAPPQLAALQQELPAVRFMQGSFDAALLQASGATLVAKSPGLAPQQIAPLGAAAQAAGIPVTGELGLFAQALHELQQARAYQPQVLAITGTNGKTTVTALTGQLVARAGKSVAVAGNIGPTLLDTLRSHLDADTLPAVWVLELSSFQLADAAPATPARAGAPAPFEPTAATVLNLTQDHLDWHGDMAAYVQAKALVFGQQALMVLNQDDPLVMALRAPAAKGRPQRACVCFGGGMPQRAGDFGIEQVNGMAWLVRAMELDPTIKLRKGQEAEALHIQRLIPAEALRIRGRHNAVNALAALALAAATGSTLAPLLFGLREYQGEPHRVESIGVVGDVEYFDDSKGTNVGATVAALNGLGPERRLVPILGGDGKGQDFTPLAAPVARYARAVVLIGRDADRIRLALQGTGVELLVADTLPQAVQLASQQARTGDAVLLSPACASLDMFDNYVHRAQVFNQAVQALALDAGTVLEGVR